MREFWSRPESQIIQKASLEVLREQGLKTDADVWSLLGWMKDPRVGTKVICGREDHVSPFKFLADVILGKVFSFIVCANRSGSKSYMSGLATWVRSSFLPKLETTILGGSFEQSEKSYKAMNDFWDSTGLRDRYLVGEPLKSSTLWKNGSEVSVLTASPKATRGPHPQTLMMDEIDEMDPEVYSSALSQPQSKHGIPMMLGRLSTNHRFGGVMDDALAKAVENGIPIYRWCIWECLDSCRDLSCSTCKLTPYCPGKSMKEANGYYNIHDFVMKLYDLSDQSLRIEWLDQKAGRSDLMYGLQYKEEVHSRLDLPDFSPDQKCYLSIDWGGSNPFSVGVWQKFDMGWVRVDEFYEGNTTNQNVIKTCKTKPWWPMIAGGVADPSRPDLMGEWWAEKVRLTPADNAVDAGIESVRNALAPIIGNPKFYVSRRCRAWMNEVKSYAEKNGRPIKEDDHAMDETRYFVRWKVVEERKGRVHTSGQGTGREAQVEEKDGKGEKGRTVGRVQPPW